MPRHTIFYILLTLAIPIPSFVFAASRKTYFSGENLSLSCDLDGVDVTVDSYHLTKQNFGGGGTIRILTYRTDTSSSRNLLIENNGPYAGRVNFEPPTIHLVNLHVGDSGVYFCEIQGIDSLTRYKAGEFTVEVNALPTISIAKISEPQVDKDTGFYEAGRCKAERAKPAATIYWIDGDTGQRQNSSETEVASSDGTSSVTSLLLLKPGLLGRPAYSTKPITERDKTWNFVCVTVYSFPDGENQRQKAINVALLYAPRVTVSIEGNRLTCNAAGNPRPAITWTRPDGSVEKAATRIYVNQSNPSESSGRYACHATNSIGPDDTAVVDLVKPRLLPTVLSTTLRYNASIPVKAKHYEIECSAELEGEVKSSVSRAVFTWTLNDRVIAADSRDFTTFSNETLVSREILLATSILRIKEVSRTMDGKEFRCRLDLAGTEPGYVRAIERAVRVNVDYPPLRGSATISIHPSSPVRERSDVTMRCDAVSEPKCTYRWFYKGHEISTGAKLLLKNISRNEAGIYECVARNYVPGSVSTQVDVTVHYPPGRVVIKETEEGLACSTEAGSLPAPFYTWLLPNGTTTSGNVSVLGFSSMDAPPPASYVCLARNILAEKNASYVTRAPKIARIGALSVAQFGVTVAVGVLLLVAVVAAILCFVKRTKRQKSVVNRKRKDLKQTDLLVYESRSSVRSLASTETPHNVFDDDESAVQGNDDVEEYRANGRNGTAGAEERPLFKAVGIPEAPRTGTHASTTMHTHATNGPDTVESPRPSSPLKLSTFAQNSTGTLRHYFTIKAPDRQKHETSLTRAYSENFKDGHLGLNPRVEQGASPHERQNGRNTTAFPPSTYQFASRRVQESPHPSIPSPLSKSLLQNRSGESDATNSSRSGVSSSSQRESKHGRSAHVKFAAMRTPSVSRDDHAYNTPPMPELPDRQYVYPSYADGVTSHTPIASSYDSGTDSMESSQAAVTYSHGTKRFQSLTLV